MPPKKPKSFAAMLRTQGPYSKAVAKPGSAFSELGKNNEANRYGSKRTHTDSDEEEQDMPVIPTRKRVKKAAPKRVTKPKQSTPAKPVKPIIESWRPAGGEQPKKRGKQQQEKLTDTLGLARISTWRLPNFQAEAENIIKQHGEFEGVVTSELVHGGESVTNVFIMFQSELVAEMVKEKINGELIEGRKVQVTFA